MYLYYLYHKKFNLLNIFSLRLQPGKIFCSKNINWLYLHKLNKKNLFNHKT